MAIEVNKKLNNEIDRIVRNYNRKIARLKLKGHERIPSKITKKILLNESQNKKELRRELNNLKRFTNRGSEEIITTKKGLKLTKWELDTLKIERRRAFREINKGLKIYETKKPKVLGRVQSVTFAEMGSSEYTNLVAKKKTLLSKNVNELTKDELKRYQKLITKINKPNESIGVKENMIEIIKKNGYMAGIFPEIVDKITSNLEMVNDKLFKDLIEDERSIKIMFSYYNMMSMPGFNKNRVADDVEDLYENLANNIEEIVENYV